METPKNMLKRAMIGICRLGARLGIYPPANHYSTLISTTVESERTRKSRLPGVAVDLEDQIATLRTICLPYQSEYAGNYFYREGLTKHLGHHYGYIEAQALHAFVRRYKPGRIVQVGCGTATYCLLKATEMNRQETGQGTPIVAIEPHPSQSLKQLPIELVPRPVQTIPLDVFTELRHNDLLFIDSAHTVKSGSDTSYLFLEVLPRLYPGVIIHVHDIYLPYDDPVGAAHSLYHSSGTPLLHALLIYNRQIRILACLSHLHCERPDVLYQLFPEYRPLTTTAGLMPKRHKGADLFPGHFPTAIYLRMQEETYV